MTTTSEEIFEAAVEKYEVLLKSNMTEDLLNETAIGIISETPESMHSSLMLKFTFILGYSKGLTIKQIHNILEKS